MHPDFRPPDDDVRLNKLGEPCPIKSLFKDFLIGCGSINLFACNEPKERTAFLIQMLAALRDGTEFLGYKCSPTPSVYMTWDRLVADRVRANGIASILLPQNCRSVEELLREQMPPEVRFVVLDPIAHMIYYKIRAIGRVHRLIHELYDADSNIAFLGVTDRVQRKNTRLQVAGTHGWSRVDAIMTLKPIGKDKAAPRSWLWATDPFFSAPAEHGLEFRNGVFARRTAQ
jgi:hypothetical protein